MMYRRPLPFQSVRALRRAFCAALLAVGLAALAHPLAARAQAQVFLTEQEALHEALPDADRVVPVPLVWDARVQRDIENTSRFYAKFDQTHCFQGLRGGRVIAYACIDNMIGKERPITYITRIDHPAGTIRMMEVMEYRERIGAKVNKPMFRDQFVGKGAEDALQEQVDIRILAGATMSSRALAMGCRKLVHMYEAYLRGLAPP
jgi:Na+-translocating ferredoxin:NAD+ oxidoreductase RnfG subunit